MAATEAVAPSLVWPFRKYFLPSNWAKWWVGYDWAGNLVDGKVPPTFANNGMIPPGSYVDSVNGITYVNGKGIYQWSESGGIYEVTDSEVVLFDKAVPDLRMAEAEVEAIELEAFAHEIPDLIYRASPTWKLFKNREATAAMQQFQESVDRIALGVKSPIPMRLNVNLPPPPDMPITVRMQNGNSIELLKRAGIFPAHQEEPAPKPKHLLHKKATVENIVRFVDDLQSKS